MQSTRGTNPVKYVKLLSKHKELCCTEIEEHLDFKGSTLSHHLKQLVDCGVLRLSRKEGTYHFYQLNQETLKRHVVIAED
ncbi:ArsR/SmtB family transcription factor [Fontibacillus panacisegetis]|uniref:ArsR/SmtB family transcription factor n=1 Tax=Fontibacillus solani TaxID=1572857 RepID=UPI0035E43A8F